KLAQLAGYTIARHDPALAGLPDRHLALLSAVTARQASLLAQWMNVGFIHGVMNTDNMALSGETIDYGPCAFMDDYDPETVFSSIDRQGRYAYDKQPQIARWNLARLAEALLPLLHEDQKTAVDLANEVLGSFEVRFQGHWLLGMRSKLGLFTAEKEDAPLVQELFDWMHASHMDFTNTFRALSDESAIDGPVFVDAGFLTWHSRWTARLTRQPQSPAEAAEKMRAHNPAVIPRNHKVEEALAAAVAGDLTVMHRLLEVLADPYGDTASSEYTTPQPPGAPTYQTFCGT
ncbi:MAG: protein adenylyltransferase SelO family protein, partial [Luteolibacter sp.]